MAAVLATPTAADILDDPEYDAVLLAIWAFIAGGLYGSVGYFVIGFALYFGVRLLGSLGDFRRARQTVGFALVPLAASLLLVAPAPACALRRRHVPRRRRRRGRGRARPARRSSSRSPPGRSRSLVIGVRVVHGWSWLRSARSLVAAVALLARDRSACSLTI